MTNLKKDHLVEVLEAHKQPLTPEEVNEFPAVKYKSARDEAIMCCIVTGLSQRKIAKAFGVSSSTVHEIIKRLDPLKMYRRDRNAKKAILADMALHSAAKTYEYMDEKKFKEASLKDLVGAQKAWVGISQDLTQTKHRETSPSRLDEALEEMEQASVEIVGGV